MPDTVPLSTPASLEPLGATLRRNLLLAAGVGAGLALQSHSLQRWLPATLVMLWPTLGGHYLEIAFLTFIRPRLPQVSILRTMARILTWLAGGILFATAMQLTGHALGDARLATWPPLWIGALGMVGIELIVHAIHRLRGLPSFFEAHHSGPRAS